jgi:hypothetical protein
VIAKALDFLRNRLNKEVSKEFSGEVPPDVFVYVNTQQDGAVQFNSGAVSIMLAGIQEERTMRPADPYIRKTASGDYLKVSPEIHLNLLVLFVARFPNDYTQALQRISDIIDYFQSHRVFNRENSTDMAEELSQLIMELSTISFTEQKDIWSLLHSAYQPSVLYKVKMIIFKNDNSEVTQLPKITEVKTNIGYSLKLISDDRPLPEDNKNRVCIKKISQGQFVVRIFEVNGQFKDYENLTQSLTDLVEAKFNDEASSTDADFIKDITSGLGHAH